MSSSNKPDNVVHLTVLRPKTRADCSNVPRPCLYVSCKHNLYLCTSGMHLKINKPGMEPWEVPPGESCALDVVEREGPIETWKIGKLLGMSRQGANQILNRALERLHVGGSVARILGRG